MRNLLILAISGMFVSSCNLDSPSLDGMEISSFTSKNIYSDINKASQRNIKVLYSGNTSSTSEPLSVKITNTNNDTFVINSNTCSTLTLGKSCNFNVKFTPTNTAEQSSLSIITVDLLDINKKSLFQDKYTLQGHEALDVVVFGDSLSDGGYANILPENDPTWNNIPNTDSKKSPVSTTPVAWIKDSSLVTGTWSFYLSKYIGKSLNVNNSSKPNDNTTFVDGTFTGNVYAAGGATTTCTGITKSVNNTVIYNPPPVGPLRSSESCTDGTIQNFNQIDNYISSHNDIANPTSIYVLWEGTNNIFKATAQTGATAVSIELATVNAGKDTAYHIEYLYNKGARKFVVINLPNFGILPVSTNNTGILNKNSKKVSDLYNLTLNTQINALKNTLPNLNLEILDVESILTSAIENKTFTSLGYTEIFDNVISSACVFGEKSLNCIPINIDDLGKGNLFADSVHPTTWTHHIIGNEIFKLIEKIKSK